ncbi:MAG: type II toxin-antitoxin system VapC family toxin [Candidatus Bathyarchaeia archaeon]|jgi:predicted nucleic acid-binding protein
MKTSASQNVLNHLQAASILDLTFYEIGNALWKESCLRKFLTKKESEILRNSFQTVLSKINMIALETTSFQGVFLISESENLSFYDASYLFTAKEKGLVLVTEDKELKAKAKKYVEVQDISSLSV